MGVTSYGSASDPLSSPSLASWAASVSAALDGSDTSVDDRLAAQVHDASDITTGTMATARLGSGTPSSSTYLRGDQTWASVSGGGLADEIPPVGVWFGAHDLRAIGSMTPSVSGTGFNPAKLVIPITMTLDRAVVQVGTAESGRNLKVWIYSSDANGMPSSLYWTSSAFSLAATGSIEQTISQSFSAGVYWVAARADATTTAVIRACAQWFMRPQHGGSANEMSVSLETWIKGNPGTYASPASSWGDMGWEYSHNGNVQPHIAFRRGS